MPKRKNYYAVARGRTPGIYRTWADCEAQVSGYPAARFQGFATLNEAETFLCMNEWPRAGQRGQAGVFDNTTAPSRAASAMDTATQQQQQQPFRMQLPQVALPLSAAESDEDRRVSTDGSFTPQQLSPSSHHSASPPSLSPMVLETPSSPKTRTQEIVNPYASGTSSSANRPPSSSACFTNPYLKSNTPSKRPRSRSSHSTNAESIHLGSQEDLKRGHGRRLQAAESDRGLAGTSALGSRATQRRRRRRRRLWTAHGTDTR